MVWKSNSNAYKVMVYKVLLYEGPLLVVKRVCFTPHKEQGEDWRRNIFQSTCNMGEKLCKLVIDSGSCENVVSKKVVRKLNLETENTLVPTGWSG